MQFGVAGIPIEVLPKIPPETIIHALTVPTKAADPTQRPRETHSSLHELQFKDSEVQVKHGLHAAPVARQLVMNRTAAVPAAGFSLSRYSVETF